MRVLLIGLGGRGWIRLINECVIMMCLFQVGDLMNISSGVRSLW